MNLPFTSKLMKRMPNRTGENPIYGPYFQYMGKMGT